jgi:hypothetical protein
MTQSRPDSVFIKTHNKLVEDRGTPMITMEHTAGAIYIIRNPLDVTLSFADHYALSIDEAIKTMATPELHTENSDKYCYEVYGSWSMCSPGRSMPIPVSTSCATRTCWKRR